jgi:hypothetical protein
LAELKFHISVEQVPKFKTVHLKENELGELKRARSKLLALLNLEDLYDQMIESFLEFKTQLYSNNLSLINNFRRDYNEHHEVRSKLNRQLFNTLNLSKIYLDKIHHEGKNKCFVKDITNDIALHKECIELRNKIYDENPSYRLGCGLRNLAQHSTLPIRTYTVGTEHIQDENNKSIQAKFHLPLAKENLINSGVKKNIVTSFGEVIDLHEVMDGYIFAISQMHMQVRKVTEPTITGAVNIISSKTKETEAIYGKSNYGIAVFENNQRIFYLELEWYEVVNYLQQKHAVAIDYRNIEHTTYL